MKTPFEKNAIIIKDFSGKLCNEAHPGIDIIPQGTLYDKNMPIRELSVQNAKRMVTKVKAIKTGRVVFVGKTNIAGQCVAIDTVINNTVHRFLYCKLGKIYVYRGQILERGSIIGKLGNKPDNDLHLHLSIVKNPPNSILSCFSANGLIDPKIFFTIKKTDTCIEIISINEKIKE